MNYAAKVLICFNNQTHGMNKLACYTQVKRKPALNCAVSLNFNAHVIPIN